MNSPISPSKLEKSISALLKWKKLQKSEQPDNFLYLILTLKNAVAKPLKSIPHKIPLPHPLLPLPTTCLIIPDPPKKSPKNSSNKLTIDSVSKKIKSENIAISDVFRLSKVRSLCGSIDLRQKFMESYDLFLVDERVFDLAVGVFGKGFCKKKVPVPVKLKGGVGLREEVERACGCQVLRFGGGSCHSVRVGESAMGRGEIVENVGEAVRGVVEFVPKKWKGVAAMHLKFSESLAMPIYRKEDKSVSSDEVARTSNAALV